MKPNLLSSTRRTLQLLLCLILGSSAALATSRAIGAGTDNEFSKPIIDIGIVVSHANETAQFLTNAIGFTELKGFSVTPERGKQIGLVNGYPVDVRVFALAEGDGTRLKVLSFPQAGTKKPDQEFIHSTLGFRYLTLYVKDMTAALARLKKAGVPTVGETPLDMGGGTMIAVVRDPDGNFVELIGPMKSKTP